MATSNIREEEVKNRLRQDFFQDYDATPILGDIDFAVTTPSADKAQDELFDREYFLWAEAKAGTSHDIIESFIQLIITIGKAHTHERMLPPRYLGAFDEEKIAFLEFHHIVPVFYQNDFNWNVTPSNHDTKEFRQLYGMLHDQLQKEISLFRLKQDEKPLRRFISQNFRLGRQHTTGVSITKNNFIFVFQRWVEEVMPTIALDWNDVPPSSVVDFFYADLISSGDYTLRETLAVVLRGNHYDILEQIKKSGRALFSKADFNDGMVAYRQFWNKYNRPPRPEYLDIILMRRDLLVPQDLRERKGSYFTPRQWVELSQQYLATELGEDWQQEYYVWDCCAGTGNLLFGLTEPYRVYASTLDNADVQVMRERIKERSLNLLDTHVFQFDFLNDPFTRLPQTLQDIIYDPERRKHLVIYINPPYAEASNARTITGTGANRKGLSYTSIKDRYKAELGRAGNELFAQFFARIVSEIPTCVLAVFSTLKTLQGPNFQNFRTKYRAKLGRIFLVPAATFDNVKGQFPIGFQIYHTAIKEEFEDIMADVFDAKGNPLGTKGIHSYKGDRYIIEWLRQYYDKQGDRIAYLRYLGTDFQHNNGVLLTLSPSESDLKQVKGTWLTKDNFLYGCIYLAVRLCIEATWLNDRDQFLYPNDGWKTDREFQSDCLMFALFHGQNRISSAHGVNHWIPFTEAEVGARDVFQSHFMHNYITGKYQPKAASAPAAQQLTLAFADTADGEKGTSDYADLTENTNLSDKSDDKQKPSDDKAPHPMTFSPEATAVMDAARELWRYYHAQPGANPNASYYDIRGHFQGFTPDKKGKPKMNTDSTDEQYNRLVKALRQAVRTLAQKIEPKVYDYGFLKA